MAEYVRFRMNAAKAGVTMALMALLGGLAERARAAPPAKSGDGSFLSFVKLTNVSSAINNSLVKIDNKLVKIDTALAKIERSLSKDYLKTRTANGTFLSIKNANGTFLKTADANNTFLKTEDASKLYLKTDGVAADSSKLGGMTPDAFVQGHGGVVSGAVTLGQGATSEQTLLTINGTLGAIIVVCRPQPGNGMQVILRNQTQATLPAVMDLLGQDTQLSLPPGDKTLTTISGGGAQQLHLQTFPPAGSTEVITLTVSAESPAAGTVQFVGQAFTGGV